MTTTSTARAPKRFALSLALAALTLAGAVACSAKQETAAPGATTAPSTTAAPSTTTTAAGGGASTTVSTAAATTTTAAPPKEIGPSDLKKALEVSDPELWALVNYDITSWDAFTGFNIPLKPGADATKAGALCEAVSKLVYAGGNDETSIKVAINATNDDITGTPVVERTGKDGTCKAV